MLFRSPMIRYNMKDVAEVTDQVCKCGRGLPLIKNVTGRALDVLIAESGEKVHGEYFNYIAEEIRKSGSGLKQYQVIQKERNSLIVRLVPDVDYSENVKIYFENKIRERMGEKIKINFEIVEKIDREKSGKLRLVKYEIDD